MAMKDQDRESVVKKLRELEDRYLAVTETSVDAIVTADSNDDFLTWNKGAEMIFGYDPEEIIKVPVTTIIPERYRKAHIEGVKRFLKTGEKRLIGKQAELEALKKDGTEFPVELSLSSWESPSGKYFGAIIRDISERRRIEGLREEVQHMMRHDLRSPLIGITGLAKMLQKGHNLTGKQARAVNLISELGEKTLGLINRSRDLLQMELGMYTVRPAPVDLMKTLIKIRKELESLSSGKGVRIRISLDGKEIEEDSRYLVQGEEDLLETMFANLIKNAVEAAPEDSPVQVTIRGEKKGSRRFHSFDIHNRGVVPEGIRDTFFDPYTTSGKKGGTGLGNHSALLVARMHRGDIRFNTSEAEGTHVIVRLPEEIDV